MSRLLGIDFGTTFLKGAVLDLDGCQLQHVRREPFPDPVAGLPVGHCEIDPAAVLAAARRLLDTLLADAPDADGLVVSSQMHCLVFTDTTGRPLSNVVTWKDQRGLEAEEGGRFAPRVGADSLRESATLSGGGTYLDWVRDRLPAAVQDELGRDVRVGLPVVTLAWLADRDAIPAGSVPASLPDFVLANLGGFEPTAEPTHAAAFGLFDLGRGDWHRDAIGRLGLPPLRWPRVVGTGEFVGTAEVGGRRLRLFAPVGDQQCALLGAGLGECELSVNVSTGSQVSVRSADRRAGDFQVRPYPGGGWLNTIVQVPAGRSLAVLVDLLTGLGPPAGDPWEAVAAAVERVPDTDLRVDLGFFGGPFGGPGSVTNAREDNLTAGHLFRAAFRGMAGNYARCAARLAPAGAWRWVVFSGGLAHRFAPLRQEVLRALGDPDHRVCRHAEDTLAGLLTLALVAGGRAATVAEATERVQTVG